MGAAPAMAIGGYRTCIVMFTYMLAIIYVHVYVNNEINTYIFLSIEFCVYVHTPVHRQIHTQVHRQIAFDGRRFLSVGCDGLAKTLLARYVVSLTRAA